MTTEQVQLLVKDLSARLSYGVKCFIMDYYDVNRDGTLYEMDLDEETCGFKDTGIEQGYWYTNVVNVKPYLRPMESMTDDEHEYYWGDNNFINLCDRVDWLNKRMFDYRGLIYEELALPAPEGMYNF